MALRRSGIRRAGTLALFGSACCLWLSAPALAASTCIGDCDGSNTVEINELVTCVNIALGTSNLSTCPACSSDGTSVPITDLVKAVNNALDNCGSITPTTPPIGSPTPTVTPSSTCPLKPGLYTISSQQGGTLQTSTLTAFAFPSSGTILADVGAGDAHCVHQVVVPSDPVGFQAPVFCIPGLGYTVQVTQTGCGIGQIDSDGGSDYTVTELGDTSFTSATCDVHETPCPRTVAPDSSILVRVTVGDGTADTCSSGTANALLAVPVKTVTWLSSNSTCPDSDGMFDEADSLIVQFPQTLDFTTDSNTSKFQDLDGDGCFISGVGPAGGFSRTGTCMDLTKLNQQTKVCKTGACKTGAAACSLDTDCKNNTGPCNGVSCTADADCGSKGPCEVGQCSLAPPGCAADADCIVGSGNTAKDFGPCRQPVGVVVATTVASGTIGSSGPPLYDIPFATTLPNSVAGPAASLHATCATPPLINFTGTVDRCIMGQ